MKLLQDVGNINVSPAPGGIYQMKSMVIAETYYRSMQGLRPKDIARMRQADKVVNQGELTKGEPMYWAFEPETMQVLIYPVPDKDYEALVQYYPQIREM